MRTHGNAERLEDLRNRPYVEMLMETVGEPRGAAPPGFVARFCGRCGTRRVFRLDPAGTWYECLRCGHYA